MLHNVLTLVNLAHLVLPELPKLPEGISLDSPKSPVPPRPIEKDPVRPRSVSSTRHRPPIPPKEVRRSRGSTLQLVSANPNLLTPTHGIRKRGRKHQHAFFNQLASIKHWFIESAKRAKSPVSKGGSSPLGISPPAKRIVAETSRIPSNVTVEHSAVTPASKASDLAYRPPRIATQKARVSLSPAPITPRSSYRHTSGGLRGRKSTSSSVSSVRSIHHVPSHSKASSTSSTSNSVSSVVPFPKSSRSPHTSVKALPSTPTVAAFPSNIRLIRAIPDYNESANFTQPSGLVFTKRKKTPFRGPTLSMGFASGGSPISRTRDSSVGGSRSASVAGRRSGEIIEEEDEDEIEEVDAFSPVAPEAEEMLEETLGENESGEPEGWVKRRHE